MTTPLQPQEYAGTLQQAEWCLDLAEPTITTLTDAAFVGQVGRDVRPLSADVPRPKAPPPQGARKAGRPAGTSGAIDGVWEAESPRAAGHPLHDT